MSTSTTARRAGAEIRSWSGCTKIASNIEIEDPWNTSLDRLGLPLDHDRDRQPHDSGGERVAREAADQEERPLADHDRRLPNSARGDARMTLSPELALVDPELAAAARALLPEPGRVPPRVGPPGGCRGPARSTGGTDVGDAPAGGRSSPASSSGLRRRRSERHRLSGTTRRRLSSRSPSPRNLTTRRLPAWPGRHAPTRGLRCREPEATRSGSCAVGSRCGRRRPRGRAPSCPRAFTSCRAATRGRPHPGSTSPRSTRPRGRLSRRPSTSRRRRRRYADSYRDSVTAPCDADETSVA